MTMHTRNRVEHEAKPMVANGESVSGRSTAPRRLAARLEPFDSYWQAPRDVERGYRAFSQYYRHNFLPHLPREKDVSILVVSCGPGYLVHLLRDCGYTQVVGIDSDSEKIGHARQRELNCHAQQAFPFLEQNETTYDAIVCEQELNHLMLDEMLDFLRLCYDRMRPEGTLLVYGLNGANPLVGSENFAHNIDHFNTFTEHSLSQVLRLAGFEDVRPFPLRLYVFWANPFNYVGWLATALLSVLFRACFVFYGKHVRILTKKIGAVCRKPAE